MERVLENFLNRFVRNGSLDVELASGRVFHVGDGAGAPLKIRFTDFASQLRFLRDPELALGELYMDGHLIVERGSIYDVVELGLLNLDLKGGVRWVEVLNLARVSLRRLRQRNDPGRSRRNVAHHYDIDARVYDLFLDSDRQYSCAYFEHPGDTLDDAQLAKKRHIAAKLLVEPEHRVLDIGCGWGGMALYLANICGASVTGITLSAEQLAIANARAAESRASPSVEFRLQDYREVTGKFDRIVSVGMFEHVGIGYYDDFFGTIASALSDDGVALLHTIGRTSGPGATSPWIDKYIFPGGYIPAMSEVTSAIERAGLMLTDVEILRLHYAETLKAWRTRFMARREEAQRLYDERFCRMWEFYLAASEAAFRLGQDVVFQFQLARKVGTVPITRDYIADRERQLRALDTNVRKLRIAGE